MKRRKRPNHGGNNDGSWSVEKSPKIDLPPGVSWPDGSGGKIKKEKEAEELTY